MGCRLSYDQTGTERTSDEESTGKKSLGVVISRVK